MSNPVTKDRLDSLIRNYDISTLFIELGWDVEGLSTTSLPLSLPEGETFLIDRVAQKRGFAVCVCNAGDNYPTNRHHRRRLLHQLSRHHYEHLLIVRGKAMQCWMVSIRPQNRPLRTVEVEWNENQDIRPLMEKLDGMIFDISEEETLGLTDVVDRVRTVFMENAETVTRRFYREFREQLSAFAEFIEGIRDKVSREWYAALMLNRLMFVYFIQKKRFLNGEVNYLENRLDQTREKFGVDKFHDHFYRHFLRRLFSEGLGTPEEKRGLELKALLGTVPYLNGGLFDLHAIELENQDIQIPDQAFEQLFTFFGQYNWHLDTRPTSSGRDINPDVIGYIFEKYINDRAAMGAYYTQEDVTGYIARNTIIPFLLNRARDKCKNAFDPETGIWRYLREHPDNYIYDAVKKGCDISDEEIPENIRCGMDTNKCDLIDRRKDWNMKTEERFALPTELWRETMARRKSYFELKTKIENEKICEIDDLIAYNLDIERFVSDALRYYEGSDFIAAFYEAIAGRKSIQSNHREKRGITVLDPACGSGAFLFAVLNILEPLYETCIERMRDFTDEDDTLREKGKRKGTKKHPQFRAVLEDIKSHQNEKYWIYKTIILDNLYGVDLMKEATEIAKLRLFLKLAAEAEYDASKANLGLEPLPDIDFNIRSGNSLVGFASMMQFEKAVSIDPKTGQGRMDYGDLTDPIRELAWEVKKANEAFRDAQDKGGDDYQQAKEELAHRLDMLNEQMNRYLAEQYGKNNDGYQKWLESHQPFHWVAEFYGIVEENGGFDVVIGNPPYVEYGKVKKSYTLQNYKTLSCGNLFAYFLERGISLSGKSKTAGMIVPISLVSTPRTQTVRNFLDSECSGMYISNYADRPGSLFNGVHQKLSILITNSPEESHIYTTGFRHWYSREERLSLFNTISYFSSGPDKDGVYPKIGSFIEQSILEKIETKRKGLTSIMSINASNNEPIYLNMRLMFWVKCFLTPKKSNEFKIFYPSSLLSEREIMATLNSNIFFLFWEIISDCWHLTNRELKNFYIHEKGLSASQKKTLATLSEELEKDLEKNKSYVGTAQTDYEYYHKKSKPIIDKIDTILAEHYSLTKEELDYIINYDIKYRTGLGKQ